MAFTRSRLPFQLSRIERRASLVGEITELSTDAYSDLVKDLQGVVSMHA
jgi:hypothetical protein